MPPPTPPRREGMARFTGKVLIAITLGVIALLGLIGGCTALIVAGLNTVTHQYAVTITNCNPTAGSASGTLKNTASGARSLYVTIAFLKGNIQEATAQTSPFSGEIAGGATVQWQVQTDGGSLVPGTTCKVASVDSF
jgi:hypothetical protein